MPEDTILRSYATLGSLASAVRDKAFLEKYFKKINHPQYQFPSMDDYPEFRIRLLNCSYKKPEESYKDYLHDYMLTHNFRPELIGVSATSCQIEEAEKTAFAARALLPEVRLIIGGSHVTIEWRKFLKKSSYDMACIGEGVETFCELSLLLYAQDYQNLANIRGLAYKNKKGEICFNGYRNPVMELDEYPFPSDSLELFIEKSQQYTNYYIQLFTGIGCCKNCTFCAQRAIHRGHIRSKSAEKIMEELVNLTAKGFRKFLFIDEEFAANRERLENFLELLEARKLGIKWAINARADSFHKELLERMHANGCINIQVGVETGDQVLLDLINKDLKLAQVQDLYTWCNAIGIRTSLYFMTGLAKYIQNSRIY